MGSTLKNATKRIVVLFGIGASAIFGQTPPKKVTRAEAMAAVTSRTQPEYPAIARQLKLEGAVELEVTVTETGTVEEVAIVSGNPVLTKPAAEAVKKWKFTPFMQDGKAVKAQAPLTVSFRR